MRTINPTASVHVRRAANKAYDAHRRATDPGLAKAKAIRQTPRWRALSKLYRQAHPLCADPYGRHAASGIATPARQVHHIIGLQQDESLAYVESNLAAVCCSCHRRLEAAEARGQSQAHLFKGQ